jgi:Na+-transporting NADH:ubiquinone oxidoreductase subunit NqrC
VSLHVLQIVREKKPMLDKRQQLLQIAKTLQLKCFAMWVAIHGPPPIH